MLILSRVCVEFHNSRGETVHRVTPGMLQTFHEAPDSIRDDPIFRLLQEERSLEAGVSAGRRRALENDPSAEPAGGPPAGRRRSPAAKDKAPKEAGDPQNN